MKNQKGITLIALIITIIVMLILVGVSVTVALNGGLFRTAKQAADETKTERDDELALSDGQIEVNGKVYASYQDYLDGKYIGKGELPEGWTEVAEEEKTEGWSENVIAITDGINVVPLPKGYNVSTEETEDSIEEGLVIKDTNNNEFVWIPVEDAEPVSNEEPFVNPYNYDANCSEPTELTKNYSSSGYAYDSQETLDYLYGTDYYDYDVDFVYSDHYAEMVESVNKYDGFFVGRYETTIDDAGNIGSKYNTTILTASSILKEGTNSNNDDEYHYRWYGLYYAQRNNTNVVGNGNIVQTNMIWGQQWDAMLTFLGTTQASSTISGTQSQVLKSGEAIYDNGLKDVMNNIYDLRRNAYDWTAEAFSADGRVIRGGRYYDNWSASFRNDYGYYPDVSDTDFSSRLALYIK